MGQGVIYFTPWGQGTVTWVVGQARRLKTPVKFYDEAGFLIGTAYPNGDIQR